MLPIFTANNSLVTRAGLLTEERECKKRLDKYSSAYDAARLRHLGHKSVLPACRLGAELLDSNVLEQALGGSYEADAGTPLPFRCPSRNVSHISTDRAGM